MDPEFQRRVHSLKQKPFGGHAVACLFLALRKVSECGRAVYTISTEGVWTLVSSSGTATDVCAVLAS